MAFVPVPQVINAFFDFTGPDLEPAGWSLDFRAPVPVTPAHLSDLGQACEVWFDTQMQPLMSAGWTLNRIKLRDLSVANGYVLDWVGLLPMTGTAVGNSMPSSVAWSLKKTTGLAGKSFRGRIYHMGFTEAQISGNYVDPVVATDILNAWEDLRVAAAGAGDGFELVVVSTMANKAPRAVGVATYVQAIVAVDGRIDTQRRRLPSG